MIIVSGVPLESSALSGTYPENSVEGQLLAQMMQSTDSFRYSSLEQLKFELDLRAATVDAARALNRSGMGFAVFHKSKCNPDYWDRSGNGGFRLKSGAVPADAIRDIFKHGRKYATECATAMMIVYYGALLKTYPEETFNRLFPSIYLMNWHELDPLLREIGRPKEVAEILVGDRCYFRNPDVSPETPELHGENVIVLPDGLYFGHGIGTVSAEQIIRVLNANRKEDATRSAYFVEDSAARPDYEKLLEASQRAAVRPAILHWQPFPQPLLG